MVKIRQTQDEYIPRYLVERPQDRFGLLKLLGVAAGTMLSVNLLVTGVADAAIGIKDTAPSADPALSQRVGDTLEGLIGGFYQVTCEDTIAQSADDPANGTGPWQTLGYVSSYKIPISGGRIMGSRIHLDNTICKDVDSIHYDTHDNPTPSLSYQQIHGLLVGAHESEHVAGIEDEAATECVALQRVAAALEVRRYDLASNITMKSEIASRELRLPDRYRSAECRVGGALDTTPDSAPSDVWLPVR